MKLHHDTLEDHMEDATLEYLEDLGFTKIGEGENDGQGSQVIMGRKATRKEWIYLLVDTSDDGYILNITGLANGKTFTWEDFNG